MHISNSLSIYQSERCAVSPGPQAVGGEHALDQQALVQVQTHHVTRSEEAHHHTEGVETQVADGKVARPPRAHADEKQEVDGREGRGQGDAWGGRRRETSIQ